MLDQFRIPEHTYISLGHIIEAQASLTHFLPTFLQTNRWVTKQFCLFLQWNVKKRSVLSYFATLFNTHVFANKHVNNKLYSPIRYTDSRSLYFNKAFKQWNNLNKIVFDMIPEQLILEVNGPSSQTQVLFTQWENCGWHCTDGSRHSQVLPVYPASHVHRPLCASQEAEVLVLQGHRNSHFGP